MITNAEKCRRYRARHPGRKASQMRAWRLKHSEQARYASQRSVAKSRGIEWLFTFHTWLAWWGSDLVLRGRGRADLCMARKGDVGPYSPENVMKVTVEENNIQKRTP